MSPSSTQSIDLSTSAKLAFAKIPHDSPAADKIYLLGRVQAESMAGDLASTIRIDVIDDMPSVALNANVRDMTGLRIPTVQEIMDSPLIDRQSIIMPCAGTFLRINNNLAVINRGGETQFKPYHLNQPIGRMSTSPAKTALSELNEELHAFWEIDSKLVPLMFTFNGSAGLEKEDKEYHLKCLQAYHESKSGTKLNIADQIILLPVTACEEDDKFSSNVTFSINGDEIEHSRMIPIYGADTHTFELNFSLTANIDQKNNRLVLLSGEPLGRDVELKTLTQLDYDLRSVSLDAYHEMKRLGYNPQIQRYNEFKHRPVS